MRQRLIRAWKHEPPTPSTGTPLGPVSFSELLAGMETVGVGDEYLIESVFAGAAPVSAITSLFFAALISGAILAKAVVRSRN